MKFVDFMSTNLTGVVRMELFDVPISSDHGRGLQKAPELLVEATGITAFDIDRVQSDSRSHLRAQCAPRAQTRNVSASRALINSFSGNY